MPFQGARDSALPNFELPAFDLAESLAPEVITVYASPRVSRFVGVGPGGLGVI